MDGRDAAVAPRRRGRGRGRIAPPAGRGVPVARVAAIAALGVLVVWSPDLAAQDAGGADGPGVEAARDDTASGPAGAEGGTGETSPERPDESAGADDEPAADTESELPPFARMIDTGAGWVVDQIEPVLFWDPVQAAGGALGYDMEEAGLPDMPLVVLWLVFGAVSFTLIMGFMNLRGFKHALDLVRGRYTDPASEGEVSHFQALCAALSATVGLGNIAGVAAAVSMGGPGAVLWMVAAGFLGMSSKFVECTLGQKYRHIDEHGRVSGGAMHYLSRGLGELGLYPLGVVLALIFAVLCLGASLGGGNMFQANQSFEALQQAVDPEKNFPQLSYVYGISITVLVGLVIIGGIRRIATTASRIVPSMCALYVVVSLYIILSNWASIPDAFATMVSEAVNPDPETVTGGLLGALVVGVQRAAFSNEAGIGSAPIAHAAARSDIPVREGFVALLEPFIDTIVVCTMTGLVVVVTGAYADPDVGQGSSITVEAWRGSAEWFKYLLALATVLFAFSTMISWSYYGERCWVFLFGARSAVVYKLIFVVFIFVGTVIKLGKVLDFSDMMLLSMALPNLLGCLLLSARVRSDLRQYWARYRGGEYRRFH